MDLSKIGLFISAMRKQSNMTQKELAEKIGVTDKAVSRWETGKGFPDVSLLLPLAEALEISVTEIIIGDKIKNEELGVEMMDKTLIDNMNYTKRKLKSIAIKVFIFGIFIGAFAALTYFYNL